MSISDELARTTRCFGGGWRAFRLDGALIVYDERKNRLAEVTDEFGSYLLSAGSETGISVSTVLGLGN